MNLTKDFLPYKKTPPHITVVKLYTSENYLSSAHIVSTVYVILLFINVAMAQDLAYLFDTGHE